MLNIAGIIQDSIVDGPGIRVTIFAQGCPHHCTGCQNPETWDFQGGHAFSEDELFAIIQQNPLAKGVTFSGGEPFAQSEGFYQLAKRLKEHHYEVASYTGYTFEELLQGSTSQQQLLQQLDVLIDGKFIQEQKSLSLVFRGSENQRILDLPASLQAGKAIWHTAPRWQGIYE